MSALSAQLGAKTEVTYGTPITVDQFFDFNSESVTATYGRIESDSMRPGRQFRSDTRFTNYIEGASGDLELEVGSKGFGFWLLHSLGSVSTGALTDSTYTHTFTPANLNGKSFTCQIGRPFYTGSSVQAFTYDGGKVTSLELSNSNDGNLMATIGCDFRNEATATALATASYPTGVESFSWVGGTVTIGGTQFDVTEASVSLDNALATDRRYLRGSQFKKEPQTDDYREVEFELEADFDSLTQQARVAAATTAGSIATTVLRWQATTLAGAATYPSLTVTINGRFDEFEANVGGPDSIMQSLSGVGVGASAISIAYTSTDVTVS